jgi:hypothetical protein
VPTLLLIWLALDPLLALLPTLTSARTAFRSRLIDLDGRIAGVKTLLGRDMFFRFLYFSFSLHIR